MPAYCFLVSALSLHIPPRRRNQFMFQARCRAKCHPLPSLTVFGLRRVGTCKIRIVPRAWRQIVHVAVVVITAEDKTCADVHRREDFFGTSILKHFAATALVAYGDARLRCSLEAFGDNK